MNRKINYWICIFVVITWFLFPIMIARNHFFISVVVVYFIYLLVFKKYRYIDRLKNYLHIKKIIFLWCLYLFFLLFASINSNSDIAMNQWLILNIKFLFFIFLLTTLKIRDCYFLLKTYSYTILLILIFALTLLIAINYLDNPQDVNQLHFLIRRPFDFGSELFPASNIYRLRGLAEEPGTFAFALFPAFFYFLFVEERKYALVICSIGLILTLSLGAALFAFLLFIIFLFKFIYNRIFFKALFTSLFIFSAILILYKIADVSYSNFYADKSVSYLSSNLSSIDPENNASSAEYKIDLISQIKGSSSVTISGKYRSFVDRTQGIARSMEFLLAHPLGAGASLGMSKVGSSISVGYIIAVVDAGILGGCIYLLLFFSIGKFAILEVFRERKLTRNARLKLSYGLACLCVLFMGLQRMQPDLSFWHMWIYASLLIVASSRSST